MTTAPSSPTESFSDTLEGVRASIAMEGTRKGPAGALAWAILHFPEMLVALLADFKAGRLVVVVQGERAARSAGPVYGAGVPNPHHGPADQVRGQACPRGGREICGRRSANTGAGHGVSTGGVAQGTSPQPSRQSGEEACARHRIAPAFQVPGKRMTALAKPSGCKRRSRITPRFEALSRLQNRCGRRARELPIRKTGSGMRCFRDIET